jgi:hypothetical protein
VGDVVALALPVMAGVAIGLWYRQRSQPIQTSPHGQVAARYVLLAACVLFVSASTEASWHNDSGIVATVLLVLGLGTGIASAALTLRERNKE